MGDQVENKIIWFLTNVSSLQSEDIYSNLFVIGGCSWRFMATCKGNKFNDNLSLSLVVADAEDLPFGWGRHAKFSFTIMNQVSEEQDSQLQDMFRDFTETEEWFDDKTRACPCATSLPLGKLDAKYGGLILNEQVKILAEINVLEAIGKSVVSEETLKKIKQEEETSTIELHGFPVHPSEVELLSIVFKEHPDFASDFIGKNFHSLWKRMFIDMLISLFGILFRPTSRTGLVHAHHTIVYMEKCGFKVGWLEEKLNEVTQNKDEEENGQN
ncbi:TRAF-like [Arabidopsis suecica]|uniref:TRAF-like n=1 Tax=Arabidopsis suecica TaxID=45249 RepID=A0A8T2A0C0_ARASU|nr:TRAF-like [Arabidopsis suecica]